MDHQHNAFIVHFHRLYVHPFFSQSVKNGIGYGNSFQPMCMFNHLTRLVVEQLGVSILPVTKHVFTILLLRGIRPWYFISTHIHESISLINLNGFNQYACIYLALSSERITVLPFGMNIL